VPLRGGRTMVRVLLIVALVVLGIPALACIYWVVHCGLTRLCFWHSQRFCRRSGLAIRRARLKPEIDSSGTKTESSLVQLDCLDADSQRRLVLLSVWPFGFRKTISNEPYPESNDSQWPRTDVPQQTAVSCADVRESAR
jgi:hypothetical protein